MPLDETFGNLAAFLNGLDAEGEQKFELSHSLVIICPDCGKNIAFRGRCPKCAGNSWIPAGHTGGVFEQMKAKRVKVEAEARKQPLTEARENGPGVLRQRGRLGDRLSLDESQREVQQRDEHARVERDDADEDQPRAREPRERELFADRLPE